MVRRRHAYAVGAGVALSFTLAGSILAQAPPADLGRPAPGGPGRPAFQGGPRQPMMRPMQGGDPVRDMSPDDRMRFQRNFDRWRQMPPDVQQELRMRESMRQQRIRTEAEAALRESGLRLEAEKREQYEQRYLQERRRIEQALRQELDEKRRRELAPVMEQLKREFSQQGQAQQPSATAGEKRNSTSPTPQK